MHYTHTTLPSGLQVVVAPMPHTRAVSVNVYVAAGSRNETPEEAGSAHFLEHLFFKGTRNRPLAWQISAAIEGVGGSINAATDRELTVYYARVAVPHFTLAVDVLADMLRNSLFDPVELEKERQVVIEEIGMYRDQPADLCGITIDECLFPDQALGRDVAGSPESVRALSRDTITGYVESHYGPETTVVSVAGGVEPDHALAVVAEAFEGWASVQRTSWTPTVLDQAAPRARFVKRRGEQAHLCLAVPAIPAMDPRRYALDLLATILGDGMSSRLFVEVRENLGLAYDVHAYTSYYSDAGAFTVYAGVDPGRIAQAEAAILRELDRVRDTISEADLQRARDYTIGRMLLRMEDSRAISSSYGAQQLLHGLIETPDDVTAALNAVTIEQVRDVARELFRTDRLNLAVVGPLTVKAQERLEKQLSLA